MRLLASLPWRRQRMKNGQPASVPPSDTYLTDGASLFRVAGTLIDLNDDALLKLEDCRTLELVLLPAGRATGLGLHPVALPQ
jgi:hypothetical protein